MSTLLQTLEEALNNYHTVDSLKKLCTALKIPQATRKGDLVAKILEQASGKKLKDNWNALDETQKLAVAEYVHGNADLFDGNNFRLKYEQNPDWGKEDRFAYLKTPSRLWLFFHTPDRYAHFKQTNAYIPEDLWKKLKPLVPKVEAAALPIHPDFENEAEIDTYHYNRENYRYELGKEVQNVVRLETETIAPYDLQAVLRLAESGKLSVSEKTLLPGVACLKQVNAALSIPDYCSDDMLSVLEDESCRDDAGEFKGYGWILLLQAAKLVHLSGKKLQLTKAGEKALNDKPEKTLKTLWQRWLKNTQFDELRRMDDIKGQTGKGKRGLTALGGRRKVINEALKACPAGEWLRVSEFSKFMQLNGFNFEVTRDPWNLYIVDNNYGSLGYHGWNILQFRYILCLLFEYAGTLGMIDVAYVPPHHARGDFRELWGSDNFEFFSRYDGLMLFRINPLGAYCLGLEKGYRAPKAEKKIVLQVLENFDIVAIDSLLPGDAMLLEQFAEKTAESVWHISEEKLLDALEQGGNLEHFTGLLDARSDGMPPEVDKLLKDVIRHSQQLTEIGSAKMIECDSSALAKQIATNAKTKRHCLLAGSRMLIVPEASEKGFRNGLKSLGYILGKGKV